MLNGPLHGIRVLDLSSVVLGPMATQVLADFGADVVKIEAPEGDLMRNNGVSLHRGMSSIYLALNRNKRSVVLDLKTATDREALRHLVEGADVLVHNMRVAAIERLGFGYDAVAQINPRIVYCAATGFGQEGPHRDKPAFDDIIQAACGLASVSSMGRDAPDYVPSLIADKTTGLAVSNAVMAALLHRERHGAGQYVEVPMLETMAAFVLTEHMGGMTFEGSTAKAGYARLLEGGRKPARTRDGWISILPYTNRHWQAFFSAAGREDLGERYSIANAADRNANIRALYAHMAELTPLRTTAQWMAVSAELDIPATPIFGLDELPSHPHLAAVGLFESGVHPTEGAIRQMRPTTRFAATPTALRRHAPQLGEHTDEVMQEAGLRRNAEGGWRPIEPDKDDRA
ncbi:CoA transferase [Variovorax sp. PDNC026]|uniref:CaiB/BaiF CoA transferase family protein n=1 Tax=Variovorax sp. PDNC026 TaxID=2811425 RepID=UPI001964F761|nr:CoA transferase [Variovorax sp. PDNC026]QRY31854.1 CoA transferase [Variovorax sp. PDNC026]